MYTTDPDCPHRRVANATRLLTFMNEKTLDQIDKSIEALIEMGAGPDIIDPIERVRERHRKAFKHTIKVINA